MLKKYLPAIFFIISVCSIILCTTASAKSNNHKQSLAAIEKKMSQLQQTLAQEKNKQQVLESELRKIDISISNTTIEQQKNKTLYSQQQAALAQKKQQVKTIEKKLNKQQQDLANVLKSSYRLGEQAYLKLLLNQEQPQQIQRMLQYHRYFSAAQHKAIAAVAESLDNLTASKKIIDKKNKQVKLLIYEQQQQQQQLQKKQQYRQQILLHTKQQISSDQDRLKSLQSAKDNLQKIIEQLKQQRARAKTGSASTINFAAMRGKLPWPITGKIIQHYASPIAKSQLKSSGIIIASNAGKSIKAIHPGKIIFANWLRGFGLLLIVDHGKGYMSLYGHNQALAKKSGAQIKQGETIAFVGNSGINPANGLYFEIRHQGKTINPKKWLK